MRKISIWSIIGVVAALIGSVASHFEMEKAINEQVEERLKLKEEES